MKQLLFFLLSLFVLTGCSSQKKQPSCDVLVSVPPYLYFVDKLTDGTLLTMSLVPPGANPHLYEPSPQEVEQARNAKVWIRLSEHTEKKVYKTLKESDPNLIVLNLAESLSLPDFSSKTCDHNHEHSSTEAKDLHIWLSLRLAKQQAQIIAETLTLAFPEQKERIKENLQVLLDSLESADTFCSNMLNPYKGNAILVSHPAFGYFCHDYDLIQLSIECEGKDPLPGHLSSLLEEAKNLPVRTVLTQAQYNNKGAEMIAEKLHLPVDEIDPYSEDYLNNILYLARCIAEPQ